MKLLHPESMWLLISEDLTGLLQMGQSTAMVAVAVPSTESQRASLAWFVMRFGSGRWVVVRCHLLVGRSRSGRACMEGNEAWKLEVKVKARTRPSEQNRVDLTVPELTKTRATSPCSKSWGPIPEQRAALGSILSVPSC
jgi:hypothetical protein